jgi:hypothetical protein
VRDFIAMVTIVVIFSVRCELRLKAQLSKEHWFLWLTCLNGVQHEYSNNGMLNESHMPIKKIRINAKLKGKHPKG